MLKFKDDDEKKIGSGKQSDETGVSHPASDLLESFGQLQLPGFQSDIHVITVIGEVEGHQLLPQESKVTKYEHIIPQLVTAEQDPDIKGLLIILNTVGGDVEAGLALAELIASMSKPTVSLVLGGGHSIGVPIAVAADHSFISSTAAMTIHPVRLTGLVISAQQSFEYLDRMQDRVINFVAEHSHIRAKALKNLMMTTGELARDMGTVLVGADAVDCGLINEVGGLSQALGWLYRQINETGIEKAGPLPSRRNKFRET